MKSFSLLLLIAVCFPVACIYAQHTMQPSQTLGSILNKDKILTERRKLVSKFKSRINAKAREIGAGAVRQWIVAPDEVSQAMRPAVLAWKDTLGADYNKAIVRIVNDRNNAPQVYAIHGAIYAKWKALGGEAAFGEQETDQLTCPDGAGQFVHFSKGRSIYAAPQKQAVQIKGAFRDQWAAAGWETGRLGYPVADQVTLDNGVLMQEFDRGYLYQPLEGNVVTGYKGNYKILYKGIKVFGECSSTQEHGGSDELYVIIGAVGTNEKLKAVESLKEFPRDSRQQKEYGKVNGGDCIADLGVVYEGPLNPLDVVVLHAILIESDQGNSNAYKDKIKSAINITSTAAEITATAVGTPISIPPEVKTILGELINALAMSGDDELGTESLSFRGQQIMDYTKKPSLQESCFTYHFSTNLFSRYGGSWKVYFEVVPPGF